MDPYVQDLTATNAKWSNGGLVTFFDAKSPQVGQRIQMALHRIQEAPSHTLALPLWSASRARWSAAISLVMQVTTRWTRRFDGAVDRASPYIEKLLERRRHLYICSLVECQPKVGRRKQVDSKLKNNVVPILQRRPGHVDFCAFRQEPQLDNCDSPGTNQ